MLKNILLIVTVLLISAACAQTSVQPVSARPQNIDTTDRGTLNLLRQIDDHLAERPDHADRHIGTCGNPMGEATESFRNIINGHPADEIIPLLGHTAPYLRSAVYGILYEMGDDAVDAIQDAYENGNPRIKYMLLRFIYPDASPQFKYDLMDQIIGDETLPVFYEDYFDLTQIMRSENINVCLTLQSLSSYPVDIYTYFLRLMQESDFYPDKAWAARMLGSFGDEAVDAIPAIVSLFDLEDDYVTPFMGGPDNLTNRSLHGAAAIALGDFGPAASEAVPALLEALNSTDTGYYVEHVRISAASSLYLIGHEPDKMVQFLVDELQTVDASDQLNYEIVGDIADHLGRIGPDASAAIPRLTELVDHEHHWVYNPARMAISAIEGNNETAVQLLINQLSSGDLERVSDAIYNLSGYINNEDLAPAIPALLNCLDQCHSYELRTLCETLIRFGGHNGEVTSRLITEIDNRADRYNEILGVFRQMGTSASAAIPVLQELIMDDEEITNFSSAVGAYQEVGGDIDWLIPRLIELIYWDKTTYNADDVAIWALRNIGPEASDALPALREIAEGADERKAMFAREAIAAIEGTEVEDL